MPSQHVRFSGGDGHALAARVDAPEGAPRAWALLAHCFTCGKDLRSANTLARTLAEQGVGVFRFDFTGVGASEGDLTETTFSSNVADLVAAADHMRAELAAPRVLVGHSLGGAAVIVAAGRIPEAALVATLAAPAGLDHFRETLLRRAPELAHGEAELRIGSSRVRLSPALLADLDSHRLEDALDALACPLLVFHGAEDRTVAPSEAELLFARARQPKAFVPLPGADHLLLADEGDARFVGEVVAAWVRRYL